MVSPGPAWPKMLPVVDWALTFAENPLTPAMTASESRLRRMCVARATKWLIRMDARMASVVCIKMCLSLGLPGRFPLIPERSVRTTFEAAAAVSCYLLCRACLSGRVRHRSNNCWEIDAQSNWYEKPCSTVMACRMRAMERAKAKKNGAEAPLFFQQRLERLRLADEIVLADIRARYTQDRVRGRA